VVLCFPDPYPDELLYSICARYSDRMQYPYAHAIIVDLFGRKGFLAITDLPSHLGRLVTNLPQKDYYTVDNLIDNHTLFPFYAPFIHFSFRPKQIRVCMEGYESQQIYPLIGLRLCGVDLQEWLRFCPLCIEEDRRAFGECYWHRVHQIPGVEICVKHAVYLQNSSIHKWKARPRYAFFSAEEVVKVQPLNTLNSSNPGDRVLLHIARSASWLIQQRNLSIASLGGQYNSVLFDQQISSRDGLIYRVDQDKVLRQFKNRYDDHILRYFNRRFDEEFGKIWPIDFVKRSDIYHPVHHLLFIHFLGYKIEDFFAPVFEDGTI
jgi:TniQ/Tn7-like transposition protein D